MAKKKDTMTEKTLETRLGNIKVKTFLNDDKMELITHNSLYDAVMHLEGVEEVTEEAWDDVGHDENGREYDKVRRVIRVNNKKWSGHGSNQLATLGSDIDKNNRYNIAVNRAMDDAILKALGLAGRYYTNEQIKTTKKETPVAPPIAPPVAPAAPKAPALTPEQAQVAKEIAEDEMFEPITMPDGSVPESVVVDPRTMEPILADEGDYVLTAEGRCKGMTIRDAHKEYGEGFLFAFKGAYKSPTVADDVKKDSAHVVRYMEAQGM